MSTEKKDNKYLFSPQGEKSLSRRVVSVKLPHALVEALQKISVLQRGVWLRKAIIEAATRDKLLPSSYASDENRIKNCIRGKSSKKRKM